MGQGVPDVHEGKLIIVEGPDGAGKSRLAKTMGRLFSMDVIHRGGPPLSYAEVVERLERPIQHPNFIYDRSPIVSEDIYGPILRGVSVISSDELRAWRKKYIAAGCVLLYCRPSMDLMIKNIREQINKTTTGEGKNYKSLLHLTNVLRNIHPIVNAYDQLMHEIRLEGMVVLEYVWY